LPMALRCFQYQNRDYSCQLSIDGLQLSIINEAGAVLSIEKGQKIGNLASIDGSQKSINVTEPFFFQLVKTAYQALRTAGS
jgi:single-stranded-DNA-specific exonuclease